VWEMCDYIVILRLGRVVALDTPGELMWRHECDTLEEVFVRLVRGEDPS
jgi:ABC-type Na+ transport system ATPase subunit NatA